MRVRIWKNGLWRWSVRRPGYNVSGRAASWGEALRQAMRELALDKAA